MSPEKNKFIARTSPPVFAAGFRMGMAEDVVVVDLMDNPEDDSVRVIYSFVMTKKQTNAFINALKNTIGSE